MSKNKNKNNDLVNKNEQPIKKRRNKVSVFENKKKAIIIALVALLLVSGAGIIIFNNSNSSNNGTSSISTSSSTSNNVTSAENTTSSSTTDESTPASTSESSSSEPDQEASSSESTSQSAPAEISNSQQDSSVVGTQRATTVNEQQAKEGYEYLSTTISYTNSTSAPVQIPFFNIKGTDADLNEYSPITNTAFKNGDVVTVAPGEKFETTVAFEVKTGSNLIVTTKDISGVTISTFTIA